jgi:CDP-4-dehydro-6-deoxyglucose reductase, E1
MSMFFNEDKEFPAPYENEEMLRNRVLENVKYYYRRKSEEKFVPGETYIKYGGRIYDENEMVSLVDSALDFWLTTGKYSEQFERDFAKFMDMKYCILTNSGSSANLLAISALTSPTLGYNRILAGDEVILTACGFPTTLNPIIQNNLTPVFVDIDLKTYTMKTKGLDDVITDKTKAIVVSHTLGNPCDMEKIEEIVYDHRLWLIEDNCDSLGSLYHGKYTGTFGHLSTHSFYPAHHITMGEGGAVLTNDLTLQRAVTSFRDWGRDCWCASGKDNTCNHRFSKKGFGKLPSGYDHKYVYSHIGYNLKVTEMQSAIGVEQLKKLPFFIAAREKNFTSLLEGLNKYSSHFDLPVATNGSCPSWFGFPIMVREDATFSRSEIVQYLEDHKIATRMLFGGNLTKQPAYSDTHYWIGGNLQNTDLVMNNLFWIGVYPGITEEMIVYILKIFAEFLEGK